MFKTQRNYEIVLYKALRNIQTVKLDRITPLILTCHQLKLRGQVQASAAIS